MKSVSNKHQSQFKFVVTVLSAWIIFLSLPLRSMAATYSQDIDFEKVWNENRDLLCDKYFDQLSLPYKYACMDGGEVKNAVVNIEHEEPCDACEDYRNSVNAISDVQSAMLAAQKQAKAKKVAVIGRHDARVPISQTPQLEEYLLGDGYFEPSGNCVKKDEFGVVKREGCFAKDCNGSVVHSVRSVMSARHCFFNAYDGSPMNGNRDCWWCGWKFVVKTSQGVKKYEIDHGFYQPIDARIKNTDIGDSQEIIVLRVKGDGVVDPRTKTPITNIFKLEAYTEHMHSELSKEGATPLMMAAFQTTRTKKGARRESNRFTWELHERLVTPEVYLSSFQRIGEDVVVKHWGDTAGGSSGYNIKKLPDAFWGPGGKPYIADYWTQNYSGRRPNYGGVPSVVAVHIGGGDYDYVKKEATNNRAAGVTQRQIRWAELIERSRPGEAILED